MLTVEMFIYPIQYEIEIYLLLIVGESRIIDYYQDLIDYCCRFDEMADIDISSSIGIDDSPPGRRNNAE
ncbi:unnamed protein product [Rotaria sp. Silwood1]|nr:unnamed protein product [Rotaria sp. Silwood1]